MTTEKPKKDNARSFGCNDSVRQAAGDFKSFKLVRFLPSLDGGPKKPI